MIKVRISPTYKLDEGLEAFVQSVPFVFDNEGEVLYQKRNTVKCFMLDPEVLSGKIVVKRYKRLHFAQGLIYSLFRKSKALRAFNNAIELRKRGIDTPCEIACVEQFEGILLRYGYYLSCFTDSLPIKEPLVDTLKFNKQIARAFAYFVSNLHEKGIMHYDLNSTNVLYHFSEGCYSFSIIDINRMKFLPLGEVPDLECCFENLTRFTGRMDLFEYVVQCYLECRGWEAGLIEEAVFIKMRHDKAWRRRKDLIKRLRGEK